jgi:AAA+ ATPase superfamily predicted ATPase
LNAEFKEPKNYKLIFKAIALGHNRLGEICNYTGLDKSIVPKYLDVLCKLHILKDEAPVTASPKFKI